VYDPAEGSEHVELNADQKKRQECPAGNQQQRSSGYGGQLVYKNVLVTQMITLEGTPFVS